MNKVTYRVHEHTSLPRLVSILALDQAALREDLRCTASIKARESGGSP